MSKPKLPHKPHEVILNSKEMGTLFWFLPEKYSKEFAALPPLEQQRIEEAIHRRFSHIMVMVFGLMKNPGLEQGFGQLLDGELNRLAASMVNLVKTPWKTQ